MMMVSKKVDPYGTKIRSSREGGKEIVQVGRFLLFTGVN